MNADRALSGLILVAAAGFGAYLFYRKQQVAGTPSPFASEPGPTLGAATQGPAAGGPPILPPVPGTPSGPWTGTIVPQGSATGPSRGVWGPTNPNLNPKTFNPGPMMPF